MERDQTYLAGGVRIWYDTDMVTKTPSKKSRLSTSTTLEQIARGLRGLSPRELETLELLVDPTAMRAISESIKEARKGILKQLA